MKTSGISLVEVIIVVAIVAVIGSSFIGLAINFLSSNNLKNKINEIAASLRTAQSNSMWGKENSQWGVNISVDKITLYKGGSFAQRDTAFDYNFDIPKNVAITQSDIVFTKSTGTTSADVSLTISSQGQTKTINVNKAGTVDVN